MKLTRLFALCIFTLCFCLPRQGQAQSVSGTVTVLLSNQDQLTFTTNGAVANNTASGPLFLNSGLFSCPTSYTSIQTMVTNRGIAYATCVSSGSFFPAGSLSSTPCVITVRFMSMRASAVAGTGYGITPQAFSSYRVGAPAFQNPVTGMANFIITNANTNAVIYSSGTVPIIQGSLNIQ